MSMLTSQHKVSSERDSRWSPERENSGETEIKAEAPNGAGPRADRNSGSTQSLSWYFGLRAFVPLRAILQVTLEPRKGERQVSTVMLISAQRLNSDAPRLRLS